ncbi:hypothetical protein ACL02S_20355 [Nocardia sp. 004]|uniref:hypothetical protein n=1 Tax=Nocardia sp. 004 TaxID=3385978 RepID=UPI0039A37E54
MRYFNMAGPCYPDLHYMLPAEERLPDARMYLEFGFYFVVHAPRQSGKTTALLGSARELTAEAHYLALCVSCEIGQSFGNDIAAVEESLLSQIRNSWMGIRLGSARPPAPW